MQKPIDAPEYISYSEWRERDSKVRRVRVAWISTAIVFAMTIGVVIAFGSRFRLTRDQNALLSALDDISNYQVHTMAYSDLGGVQLRDETHEGSDWQISLYGGKVVFTKIGQNFTTYEPIENVELSQDSWYGSGSYAKRIRAALLGADPWNNGTKYFSLIRTLNGHKWFRLDVEGARYLLIVDDQSRPVQVRLDRNTDQGWRLVEYSEFIYGDQHIVDPKNANTQTVDLTDPSTRSDLLARDLQDVLLNPGRVAPIRAIAANEAGAVFFLTEGLQGKASAEIKSSDGAIYSAKIFQVESPDDGRFQPIQVIMGVRLKPGPIHWPLRFHMDLSSDFDTHHGQFDANVARPSCDMIPTWLNDSSAGDKRYFDYLVRTDQIRGDYYSNIYHRGAQTALFAEPGAHNGFVFEPEDREKGLAFELAAIDDHFHFSMPQAAGNDATFLADAWFAVYRDLLALEGRKGQNGDRLQRVISNADDAARLPAYQGKNKDLIDAALAYQGLVPGR